MYVWVKLYLSTLSLYPPHPRTRDPALWAAQKDWVAPRVALSWWNIYSPLRGYRSNYFHRPFFLSTFYVFLSFNAFVLSKANFQAWPSDSRLQRSHISLSPLRKRDLLGFIVFQLYVIFPAYRYFSFEFASDLLFRTQSCFRLSLSLPYANKVFVEVQLGYSSSEQGYPSF